MSKTKKALITAAVFLAVGITGSIISGFYMVPKVASEVYRVQREIRNATPTEREVFNTGEGVEVVDIKSLAEKGFNVEVKLSTDANTKVKVYEYLDGAIQVQANYDANAKKLVVTGERTLYDILDADNIKGLFERGYNAVLYTLMEETNRTSQIVIEVPKGVDINFEGNYYNNLLISDSAVLKDNFTYYSSNGYVNLPFNNTLKNIDIKSNGYLEIDLREFINADKVNIEANSISIESRGYESEYTGIEKLPESVNIYGNHVDIESYMPIGKNVIIDGDDVDYESNFEAYPMNVQLRGRSGGRCYYYGNGIESNFGGDRVEERYEGIIGKGQTSEYNLVINRYYDCELSNVTSIELESDLR